MRGTLLVVCLLLATGGAAVAENVTKKDRFQLWNDCRPMGLSVDGRSDPETVIGPIKEDIIVAARARLRAADLYTALFKEGAGAYAHVRVEVVGNDIAEDVVQAAFHVQVSYAKFMIDTATGLEHFLPAWQTSTIGTYGRGPILIHRIVAKIIDDLVDEYLRVNEAACRRK